MQNEKKKMKKNEKKKNEWCVQYHWEVYIAKWMWLIILIDMKTQSLGQ